MYRNGINLQVCLLDDEYNKKDRKGGNISFPFPIFLSQLDWSSLSDYFNLQICIQINRHEWRKYQLIFSWLWPGVLGAPTIDSSELIFYGDSYLGDVVFIVEAHNAKMRFESTGGGNLLPQDEWSAFKESFYLSERQHDENVCRV